MKIYYTIIFFILIQVLNAQSKNIFINIDAANFKSNDSLTRWELYYSYPDTSMTYIRKDTIFEANFSFSIKIKSKDRTIHEEQWFSPWKKNNSIDVYKMDIIGKKIFSLLPGKYLVELLVKDLNDNKTNYSNSFPINVKDYSQKTISISDIELANIIKNNNKDYTKMDAYSTSDLYILPNPSLTYINEHPKLLFYYELYNPINNKSDSIMLDYTIFNSFHKKIIAFKKNIVAEKDNIYDYIEIPIDSLYSGVYFLNINYSSKQDKYIIDTLSTQKKFYVVNVKKPSLKQSAYTEDQQFSISEWATLNEEAIETEFQKAKYIATPQEIGLYKELTTLNAKQKFLYRFWKVRDTDTTTYINEFLESYRELIKYTNNYFSYGLNTDGWKTDRGRVYLKYGKPTSIETHIADNNTRPYDVWLYAEKQGGLYFYFVDVSGNGKYILVHSNGSYEVKDENWYVNNVRMYGTTNSQSDDQGK